MLNNSISSFLKNKYFFVLCFYLKTSAKLPVYSTLYIGYKYKYLILNINIFLKTLKIILASIKQISYKNGTILFLFTRNKILNYILQQKCKKTNTMFLSKFEDKQMKLLDYLTIFPDLVISFDYMSNAIFINKLAYYNVPVICFTNLLTKNIISKTFLTLICKNTSLYSNIILSYLCFIQISKSQFKF